MKKAQPVDVHVGARVRSRRQMLGITQAKLAEALGMSFQQVQKYETGANRISASKLQAIARALKVTPPYFFEGYSTAEFAPGSLAVQREVAGFYASPDVAKLARSFGRINDVKVRLRLVHLVERLAEQ